MMLLYLLTAGILPSESIESPSCKLMNYMYVCMLCFMHIREAQLWSILYLYYLITVHMQNVNIVQIFLPIS